MFLYCRINGRSPLNKTRLQDKLTSSTLPKPPITNVTSDNDIVWHSSSKCGNRDEVCSLWLPCLCAGQARVRQRRSKRSHSTLVLLSLLPDAQEPQRRLSTHRLLPGDIQRTGTDNQSITAGTTAYRYMTVMKIVMAWEKRAFALWTSYGFTANLSNCF